MTTDEKALLNYAWADWWARPEQRLPAGDWQVWLILAGRGFGKSRTGAETMRHWAETGEGRHMTFAGATADDVRDIMILGESGILACSPPDFCPIYNSSRNSLTWPNGAKALLISADKPDRFRGKQCDHFWADEVASWRYPDAWDQLLLGHRLGRNPQGVVTTTPRPTKLIRAMMVDPTVTVTRGSTYDNQHNLAPQFLGKIIRKYEGTRLGRQELNAEILEDVQGALWTLGNIDEHRVDAVPDLIRIVVGVDPAAKSSAENAETGIVAAGISAAGHGYVLEDASLRDTPHGWATAAVNLYNRLAADRIIAEINNGGDMVEYTIRTVSSHVPVKAVHASKGKQARAEPVSALYERGLIHHVGVLSTLEDQMTTWVPGISDSPDRVDALVWAFTELFQLYVVDEPPKGARALPVNMAARFGRR